jgi:hypothetical protein
MFRSLPGCVLVSADAGCAAMSLSPVSQVRKACVRAAGPARVGTIGPGTGVRFGLSGLPDSASGRPIDQGRRVARLARDEQVLLRLRPHWRVLVGAVVWAMLLAAIAGAAAAALEAPWVWVVVAGAGLAWLGPGARPTWRWWTTQIVVTDQRLLVRRGLVGGSRIEVLLDRVLDVGVARTLGQRLLGSGTVVLELAGATHELRDVPDPEELQRVLTEAMRAQAR